MKAYRVVLIPVVVAVLLVVVGVILGPPQAGIEGAYFNRSAGTSASAGVYALWGTGAFDASDGNLWLGAGTGLLVASAAFGLWLRIRKPMASD